MGDALGIECNPCGGKVWRQRPISWNPGGAQLPGTEGVGWCGREGPICRTQAAVNLGMIAYKTPVLPQLFCKVSLGLRR
jgi:hypothetical protein